MFSNKKTLTLIDLKVGLTNYTHTPFVRAPEQNFNNVVMDELVLKNKSEGLSKQDILNISPLIGGLACQATGPSNIRNGYQEYNKGMMLLVFLVNNGSIFQEFIHVIGYIVNNSTENGLSENATFVPVSSWHTKKIMSGGVDYLGESIVREQIGSRVDYMVNDGSIGSHVNLSTMRPGDVYVNAVSNMALDAVKNEIDGYNYDGHTVVGGDNAIDQLGVVCSNRKNYNPTSYAESLLGAAVSGKQTLDFDTYDYQKDVISTENMSSQSRIIDDLAYNLNCKEQTIFSDPFLMCMREGRGMTSYSGFRGWTISELCEVFPEFESCVPEYGFVTLDRSQFSVNDYTLTTKSYGTALHEECISQEIIFNILDLMIKNGIGGIAIEGNNYLNIATEDALSNITLVPYNGSSLLDNDVNLSSNMFNLCEDLRRQIMRKLNGLSFNNMTPINFKLEAELFGITQIWIKIPTEENMGLGDYDYHYAFPTYAPSPWSPIMNDSNECRQLSDSIFAGLHSYFLK